MSNGSDQRQAEALRRGDRMQAQEIAAVNVADLARSLPPGHTAMLALFQGRLVNDLREAEVRGRAAGLREAADIVKDIEMTERSWAYGTLRDEIEAAIRARAAELD